MITRKENITNDSTTHITQFDTTEIEFDEMGVVSGDTGDQFFETSRAKLRIATNIQFQERRVGFQMIGQSSGRIRSHIAVAKVETSQLTQGVGSRKERP